MWFEQARAKSLAQAIEVEAGAFLPKSLVPEKPAAGESGISRRVREDRP